METHNPMPGHRSISTAQIAAALNVEALADQLGPPSRDKLILAQKDAAKALRLRGATRHVLEKLCACYGGKPVNNQITVWPSNAYLVSATGYDESSIRRAIKELIDLGLVIPKDSARRHRYARRGPGGVVLDAFGFILTPLNHRHAEFAAVVLQVEQERKARAALDDDITRHRIAARTALVAALPYDQTGRVPALLAELASIERKIPRRQDQGDRTAVLAALTDLRARSERVFYELTNERTKRMEIHDNTDKMHGSAVQDAHHLEKNPENSTESYKAAFDLSGGADSERPPKPELGGAAPTELVTLQLVVEACPDIEDAGGHCRTIRDLVEAGKTLRPSFGASPDAWAEGERRLGPVPTALLAIYVHQLACDDVAANGPVARGSRCRNFGGLFRWLIRKTAEGEFTLRAALLDLRKKRMS